MLARAMAVMRQNPLGDFCILNNMFISQKSFLLISAKTNGRCFYCNKWGEVVDHFISRKKWAEWCLDDVFGNSSVNELKNLFIACNKCNASKSDKDPEDFMGNSFKAYDRTERANRRVGIIERVSPRYDPPVYTFGAYWKLSKEAQEESLIANLLQNDL